MATDICFPITKYSHATGVRNDNTIPWTHITAPDIFVLVKGVSTSGTSGRLMMYIVQGNGALEEVNIAEYVDRAVEARRHFKQDTRVEQLPIFGITKEALLAIRYKLPNDQARRLQLRMRNATECRQVVGVFERRGMEFQEQRPRTARLGTGRPTTSDSSARPLTMQTNSAYFEPRREQPRPNPFRLPPIEAGSLSQLRPPSPERQPTPRDSFTDRLQSSAHDMPPPRLFSRDEASAPREAAPTRPTTAQIYRSCTTPTFASQNRSSEVTYQPPGPLVEGFSSTSNKPSVDVMQELPPSPEARPATTLGLPSCKVLPAHTNGPLSSGPLEPLGAALLSSDPAEPSPHTGRPSSSATTAMPDTLEHEIPPRRELPFGRPESRRSGSDKSSSRPATSALTLPPLPKPKLSREDSASPIRHDPVSPTKKMSPARPSTASPLKRSFEVHQDEQASTESAQAVAITESQDSPTRKPSRMDELLYGRKPLGERSSNTKVPRLNSLADAPHETISPPMSQTASPVHTGTVRDPTIGACVAITLIGEHPQEVSLQEYATQSLEDRQATLDEFMVEHIEDPGFTILCQDVENCWRRIALGL